MAKIIAAWSMAVWKIKYCNKWVGTPIYYGPYFFRSLSFNFHTFVVHWLSYTYMYKTTYINEYSTNIIRERKKCDRNDNGKKTA